MKTIFYIRFTIKTVDGFEHFAQFSLGSNREFANDVFKKLKGTEEVDENNILQLDFIAITAGLPVNLNVIRCTLGEMADNCRIITKEIFKFFNMEQLRDE